jgi:hypothetical protein
MFVVTEAEAAAIRAAFEERGELSAAVELRRLFPAVTDTAQAARVLGPLPAGSPSPARCARRRGAPEETRYRPTCLIAALPTKAW